MRVGPLLAAGAGAQDLRAGIGIQVRGDGATTMTALAAMPALRFLAATTGRFDAIGTIHGESMPVLVDALDEVRRMASVTSVESWMHLELVKESCRFDLSRALGPDVDPTPPRRNGGAGDSQPVVTPA